MKTFPAHFLVDSYTMLSIDGASTRRFKAFEPLSVRTPVARCHKSVKNRTYAFKIDNGEL